MSRAGGNVKSENLVRGSLSLKKRGRVDKRNTIALLGCDVFPISLCGYECKVKEVKTGMLFSIRIHLFWGRGRMRLKLDSLRVGIWSGTNRKMRQRNSGN